MLHRRRFVSAIALAPVVLPIAPGAIARAESDPTGAGGDSPGGGSRDASSQLSHPGAPAPGSLGAELELAGGFRVVRARDVHCGTLSFVLEGEGERFQLDVLRNAPAGPRGVFETEHFSVFVHGFGATATVPAHERGARALGAALERSVQAGVPVPALASFLERRAQYPRGGLGLA